MSRSKVGRILREQEGFGIERVQDHHFSLKGYDEGSDHWEILRESLKGWGSECALVGKQEKHAGGSHGLKSFVF